MKRGSGGERFDTGGGDDDGRLAATTGGASGADLRELVRRSVLADGDELTTATLERFAGDRLPAAGVGLYV